ncbi:MAG: fumarylacetoacetate hydrolase family protein [Clostridiales bacterium]|nr:fumarylacetoacetate hydrolase family protein [Clostridiales bacterium]
MKIIRAAFNDEEFYGILEGETVKRLIHAPYDSIEEDGRVYSTAEVRFLAPAEPSKIVAIGKNYRAHADEMGEGQPEEPLLFLKPSTSIVGNGDDVVYPEISHRLDYEGELGVVIGKKCHAVQPGHSSEVIFGYTCLNDITARDIQKAVSQWTRGKGFDTFCPIGPHIETEIDPTHAPIETRVNGVVRQHSTIDCMTHNIDKLVCYITECMTLLPGDVIATGTPEGIGSMQRGDIVEVEIGGIGVLKNRIV